MKISEMVKARKAEIQNGLPVYNSGSPELDLIFELGNVSIVSQVHRKGGSYYAGVEITVDPNTFWDHETEEVREIPSNLVGVWEADNVILDYNADLTKDDLTHLRKKLTEIHLGSFKKLSESDQRELFAAYNGIEPTGWDQAVESHFVGFSMCVDMLGEI